MNQREIRARIRTIQRQIEALLRELTYLITLVERGDDEPHARLHIIRGGLAVFAALAALAGWLRRRPAALVGAAVAAGTGVLVLVAPQGGTAPTQQLSLPPVGSFARSIPAPPSAAPTTAPTTPSAPATRPTSVASPPDWVYLSAPSPTPTSSGTAPTTPGSTPPYAPAPSSQPTTSASRCVIEAVVPRVIYLCVGD